ncbi:hypothetical protein [Mycolicibacterium grossiae]|uniref:hypothetical protein n=1 Tax=Mycolicibacterium grossiae TaxID=1552759 RepID=UPI0011F33DD5|nr:hypothetical protein [Mycolicibacterium grossiae]QEM44179.1 hypothetical protein FZ046_04765 [Mycolicibacterium grossiae]
MSAGRPSAPALLRGMAVAASTATLAATAHAAAGGGVPSGAAAVQLSLLGGALGAVVAVLRGGHRFPTLVAVLAAGQGLGHLLLSAAGHHHGAAATALPMLAGHAAAVVATAALVVVGEALCRAVTGAARAVVRRPAPPEHRVPDPVVRRCDHPLLATRLLVKSWSYRGPPVAPAR